MIEFHDPRAERSEPPYVYTQKLDASERPLSLALTSIEKFESTRFLEILGESIADHVHGVDTRVFVSDGSLAPWSDADVREMIRSQAAVSAYGH